LNGALRPLSTLVALGLVLMLLGRGAAALYATPVAHISVTGKLDSRHREAVRTTVASRIDSGLLALDLKALQAELQALPWIYRATLRRQFPDTLEIRVIEQLPIARWGDSAFLNHEARVIEVADAQRWDSLPLIRGPEGSEARLMSHYQRLLELLRPLELQPLSLEEDDFGQLSVALDNGVQLVLGDRDHFGERVDNFLTLWRVELRAQAERVLRVDMRYADGAAVAFSEAPQIAALATATQDG
jgi:cell division protein FtsQ